jgi:6-pyruvoyltetrahydropterin/6-carboxytetrahydropterin synthase
MRATRTFEFDAAHRLPLHDGKCRRLHGHRYKVEVTVRGSIVLDDGPEHGMVMDFARIDVACDKIKDRLDHRTMLLSTDPLCEVLEMHDPEALVALSYTPTAENLALHFAYELIGALPEVQVAEVTVWETPRGRATWVV